MTLFFQKTMTLTFLIFGSAMITGASLIGLRGINLVVPEDILTSMLITGVVMCGVGLMIAGRFLERAPHKAQPQHKLQNTSNPVNAASTTHLHPLSFSRHQPANLHAKSHQASSTPDHIVNVFERPPSYAEILRATAPQNVSQSHSELSAYGDDLITELLYHGLERNRIDVFVQPIVTIPQRRVEAFEFYGRVRAKPGLYIPAGKYSEIAAREGIQADIDNRVLMKCLEALERQLRIDIQARRLKTCFLNISAATLTDQAFMHRLLQFLGRNRALSSMIVLEISEHDFKSLPRQGHDIFAGLNKIGVRLSLSAVQAQSFNISALENHNVRFVRISAPALVQEITKNPEKSGKIADALHAFDGHAIELIADCVESNAILAEILDLPIKYAQGYLFGKPDSPGAYKIRLAA